jgi:hypothetical protein
MAHPDTRRVPEVTRERRCAGSSVT